MSIEPASRVTRVQPPATLAAGEKARQQARLGKDIIDLSQSSPHHVTPDHIIRAGVAALEAGLTNISSNRHWQTNFTLTIILILMPILK
jgi:aspartate aminotransferase